MKGFLGGVVTGGVAVGLGAARVGMASFYC